MRKLRQQYLIVLFVSHGGNRELASFFLQLLLEREKPYVVYLAQSYWDPGFRALRDEVIESENNQHAGETETSMVLAIRPDLVKMASIDEHSGKPLGRQAHLKDVLAGRETSVSWYANYPDHYAGDARPSTAEKGERLLEYLAERLAQTIKAVKEDTAVPELYREFFSRTQH